MKELLSEIDENGGTDAALAGLREKQYRQYCCELIWRYPISQGDSAGGFLIAKVDDQIRIVRICDKENDDSIDEFSPEALLKDYFTWASSCIENEVALSIITEELNDPQNRSLEKALVLSANVAGMTCNRTAAYR